MKTLQNKKSLLLAFASPCLLLTAGALPSSAALTTLDFTQAILETFPPGTGISNGSPVPQGYGDIPGQLDVVYSSVTSIGSSTTCGSGSDMRFWANNYSDLTDVAYGCSGGTAQVSLIPSAGYQVTLLGFDLGSWPNVTRNSQVGIYNADLASLIFSDPSIVVSGTTATQYNFIGSQFTRSDGIQIQFGPDGYDVGIDNIRFDVSPTNGRPQPSSVPGPLPFLGVGAAFGISRKLRKRIESRTSAMSTTPSA
jgi:hypothetical protein